MLTAWFPRKLLPKHGLFTFGSGGQQNQEKESLQWLQFVPVLSFSWLVLGGGVGTGWTLKKKWFHLVLILENGGNKERNMVYRLTLTVLGDFIDGALIVIYFCQASSFSVSLAFVRRTTTTTTTGDFVLQGRANYKTLYIPKGNLGHLDMKGQNNTIIYPYPSNRLTHSLFRQMHSFAHSNG